MPSPAKSLSSLSNEWADAQRWEVDWWGDCANTFSEENKQITYAHRMGLRIVEPAGRWPLYDMGDKSVLDIGGGPVSILLKCMNVQGTVVDPAVWPSWVMMRYQAAEIDYYIKPAEHFHLRGYDEAWLYNVLQHTLEPKKVIGMARAAAKTVRIFEWIDIPPYQGHLHELRAAELDEWLGITGTVEEINENGMVGRAYYGVTKRP